MRISLGVRVRVPLGEVEELPHGRLPDGVRLLLGGVVVDVELLDQGLLQDVGVLGAAEQAVEGRAAQAREAIYREEENQCTKLDLLETPPLLIH